MTFHRRDYIKITVFGFALTALWQSLHTIILPLRLLDFVPEAQKNTSLGLLTLTGLLLAMVVQPAAGALSDRSAFRWGRRRPYILIGSLAALPFISGIGLAGSYAAIFVFYCLLQASTNIAQGMLRGLEMLGINANNVDTTTWTGLNDCSTATDHCGRGGAVKRVMIIMSDGVANTNPWDNTGAANQNCYAMDLYQPNTGHQAEDRAKDCVMYYAQIAANNNVTMYTIGLGAGADDELMLAVAELPGSNGQYFAATSSAELDAIYDAIMQISQ